MFGGFLSLIVGSKVGRIAVDALVVGLLLYGAIQYGESQQKTKQAVQQQKVYTTTRQRIDHAVAHDTNPTADAARKWLQHRQSTDKPESLVRRLNPFSKQTR